MCPTRCWYFRCFMSGPGSGHAQYLLRSSSSPAASDFPSFAVPALREGVGTAAITRQHTSRNSTHHTTAHITQQHTSHNSGTQQDVRAAGRLYTAAYIVWLHIVWLYSSYGFAHCTRCTHCTHCTRCTNGCHSLGTLCRRSACFRAACTAACQK